MKSATKPATEIDSPVAIRIDDAAWEGVARDLDACCRRALDAVFDATGMPPAQVSLLFTDDAAMRDLNGTSRPTKPACHPATRDFWGMSRLAARPSWRRPPPRKRRRWPTPIT
jgi:hypothetical protein